MTDELEMKKELRRLELEFNNAVLDLLKLILAITILLSTAILALFVIILW